MLFKLFLYINNLNNDVNNFRWTKIFIQNNITSNNSYHAHFTHHIQFHKKLRKRELTKIIVGIILEPVSVISIILNKVYLYWTSFNEHSVGPWTFFHALKGQNEF